MHVVISVGSLHVSIATIAFFKRKTNKQKNCWCFYYLSFMNFLKGQGNVRPCCVPVPQLDFE